MSTNTANVPAPPPLPNQENIQHEVTYLKELLYVRMDAMDKAVALLHENITRFPTDVDKAVSTLEGLHEEKFRGIAQQFILRDAAVSASVVSRKEAVDAALRAAKDAVNEQNKSFVTSINKSEESTTKTIDGLSKSLTTATHGLESQITDLKDRMTRLESMGIGRTAQTVDLRANIASAALIIGMFIALAGYFVTQ